MNPDCRDGKHASCSGDGWDEDADRPYACPCNCHHQDRGSGPGLAAAILTRRLRKCIAEGAHQPDVQHRCPRCGIPNEPDTSALADPHLERSGTNDTKTSPAQTD